jgi:hypothetical protein
MYTEHCKDGHRAELKHCKAVKPCAMFSDHNVTKGETNIRNIGGKFSYPLKSETSF